MSQATQTLRFASGISDESEIHDALDEVMGPVSEAMGEGPVDLALAFVSPHHADDFPRIAERIERQLQPRVALAVTAGAVLGGGVELERRAGIAILAGRLPGVMLHSFDAASLNWPAPEHDPAALRAAVTGEDAADIAGMLLFADPFSTPMVKLIPALSAALPGVPVVGGMASGGFNPGDNRLLLNGRILREGLIGVSLRGDLRVDCTVSQGCRPIGQPWIITKARHNVIQELGGRNVLQVIRSMVDTLSDEDRRLAQQGLLVGRVIDEYKDRFGRGDFLIRNIIGADEASGYIAIADLVRVGQTVQFHVRDAKAAEEDLRLLLEQQKLHGPAAGAVLCTCNGRGAHMFGRPGVESSIIAEALGQPPLAGFFAAGEIGPIGHQTFLHGFTASLAVFRPAEKSD
jgi:small ligand-binding sensory domain FIST